MRVRSILACLLGAMGTGTAYGDLTGFGGSSSTGYSLNGGATVSGTGTVGDTLTLTDNATNEARSDFANAFQPFTTGFTAQFTYHGGTAGGADGVAFVLQDVAPTSVGSAGGALAYGGAAKIFPSAAFEINIYNGQTVGTSFTSWGGTNLYNPTGSLNVASGNPLAVTLSYNVATFTMTQNIVDANAGTSNTSSYPVILSNVDSGSGTTYIGFTGATGGATSTQTITNFTYVHASQTAKPIAARDVLNVADGTLLNGHTPDVGGGAWTVSTGNTLAITGKEVDTTGAARVASVLLTTPLSAGNGILVTLHEENLGGFFGHLAGFDLLVGGTTKAFFGNPTGSNSWSIAADNNGTSVVSSGNTTQGVDVAFQYFYDNGVALLYVNDVQVASALLTPHLAINGFGFENNSGGDVKFGNLAIATTPEPASLGLVGLAGLGLLARRRRHA